MEYHVFKGQVEAYLQQASTGVHDLNQLSHLYSILTGAKVECKPCIKDRMLQMLRLYVAREDRFKPAITLILSKMATAKKNNKDTSVTKSTAKQGAVTGYKFSKAYNDLKKSNYGQAPVISAFIGGQMVTIRDAEQLTPERAKELMKNPRYAHLIEAVHGEGVAESEEETTAFDTSSGTVEGDTEKPGQAIPNTAPNVDTSGMLNAK